MLLLFACAAPPAVSSVPVEHSSAGESGLHTGQDSAPDSADTASDSGHSGQDSGDTGQPLPPNLVVVILDDFGLDMASFDPADPCYEVGELDNDPVMPNAASLCARGMRFEQAWATPTCSPTRVAVLTGQHPYRSGVWAPVGQGNTLSLDALILPALLPRYATANIGKWHVTLGTTDPNTMGWHHFAGSIKGSLASYTSWERTVDGLTGIETGYATSVQGADARAWLQTAQEPFLLWLAFNAPHAPYEVPPGVELEEYSDGDAHPWAAAMSQVADAELGLLFEALQQDGRLERTVVVLMGDNGSTKKTGDLPYKPSRRKGTLYQGGLHVPLVIAGPGVAHGSTSALVSAVDLFPTLLELAGESPTESDCVSFASCLPTGECEGNEALLAQVSAGDEKAGTALRTATHKLICFEDGHAELYAIVTDPFEVTDLYDPEDPVYQELRARIRDWTGEELCP